MAFHVFLSLTTLIVIKLVSKSNVVAETNVEETDDTSKLSKVTLELALQTFQRLKRVEILNSLFSPLNIALAFIPFVAGFGKEKSKDLFNVLRYNASFKDPDELLKSVDKFDLKRVHPNYFPKCLIVLSSKYETKDEFIKFMKDYKFVEFVQGSFKKNYIVIEKVVNDYVRDVYNTLDYIITMHKKTRMVMVCSARLNVTFALKFNSNLIKPQKFDGLVESLKVHPFWNIEAEFPYVLREKYSMVSVPLKENLQLVIILPSERNGLRDLINQLTLETLTKDFNDLKPTSVKLSFPQLQTKYMLTAPHFVTWREWKHIFTTKGDYSRMASGNFALTEFFSQSILAFKESETDTVKTTTTSETSFNASHPFIYFILTKTNVVVFAGSFELIVKT